MRSNVALVVCVNDYFILQSCSIIFTDNNMLLHANMSLFIQNIRSHQFGAYTCTAQNRLGSDSATVRLQTVGKKLTKCAAMVLNLTQDHLH